MVRQTVHYPLRIPNLTFRSVSPHTPSFSPPSSESCVFYIRNSSFLASEMCGAISGRSRRNFFFFYLFFPRHQLPKWKGGTSPYNRILQESSTWLHGRSVDRIVGKGSSVESICSSCPVSEDSLIVRTHVGALEINSENEYFKLESGALMDFFLIL